ncbi:alpha/beta hydrolase [Lacinutrix sp. C3R15]|uniref:alpha/beta hydrolase n=1 Tax=Flavobacteriaceae TaxID=49546 RepID=UPI001C07FB93|nr:MULTISPECIES: alpha/beta hydrolase [Flavobacteriaceae]MBU2938885.1 alpha/beta hydrolase [Lacinutrix sp. C3R15]MDO6622198.1 alpha/beta hydrolase [Oceanihabitans sp. 1_MG-2023]
MNQELIHVYLMPGMAANPSIFEYIKLPKDKFKIHLLAWMNPNKNETLSAYAKRMTLYIEHENVVLLGVSFGGILVQEMSKHIKLRKLIIVSSVKTMHELPKRMKIAKYTKAYKILPTSLAGNLDALAKYSFGKNIKKRIALYKKYMSVYDKVYLDWAIEQVVCWQQEKPIPEAIHIHGEKDVVFPHKYVCNCITVKGGTHIMIINKYRWFNKNLPQLILQ